ncbi:hypothetical protein BCR34DRAFT_628658 [Clohesyomyces aquaticus]|uniref:UBA domain-containing protein n=1 Tax=Clohesyomyces aquaticus TaxID=1231657 RepID=A0A1Y1YGN5_9PLEO|nr:hypothetical protein BCR34DRAFT_628658 [Clohesyomyces aquaticus]
MDDLAGLDFSAPSRPNPTPTPPSAFPPYRQTPPPQLSGRSTPLPSQLSGTNRPLQPPSKPATPANDIFASLVSTNASKAATNKLSLQERQKQLQEERQRQEADRKRQLDTQYGATDNSFWDTLGSGKSTPEPSSSGLQRTASNGPAGNNLSRTINKPFAGLDTSSKRPLQPSPAEDDLLAAFNSAAPVDSSSHFPKPSALSSGRNTPAYSTPNSRGHTPLSQPAVNTPLDDDDIFGLNQLSQNNASSTPAPVSAVAGDDDILGLLSKPVSEFQKKPQPVPVPQEQQPARTRREPSPAASTPFDKAVAELVDMGFDPDKSAIALTQTESGTDVQAAVGWILNQAHAEAKQKAQERGGNRSRQSPDEDSERRHRATGRSSARDSSAGGSKPAWMREDEARSRSGQRRQDRQSANQEKDVSQYASQIGSTFIKSAGSLWKTGQKKVQRAVADFQQDGDPNMPKWMRDAQAQSQREDSESRDDAPGLPSWPRKGPPPSATPSATDEALMLESGGRPGKASHPIEARHTQDPHAGGTRREPEQTRNGLPDRMSSQSPSLRQPAQSMHKRPASKLSRQDVEEQSAQAYVSPARRKKATPQPDSFPPEKSNLSTHAPRQSPAAQSNNPFLQARPAPQSRPTPPNRSPAPTPSPKPRPPPRQIPPASSSALNSSAAHRQKGSEAFKRGDYSAAHIAYSSALSPLPQGHPVMIVVLCNRAVTNIKVGDPKAAVSDADAALAIIGVSKGDGEKIAVGGTEGEKDMKEFYGKALMRKAEALEHMEKWADALQVWKEAVEAGVGGAVSISGRNRCDKAARGGHDAPQPATAKRPPVRKAPPPRPSALSDLGGGAAADSEAVKRLKQANAAAEKADDEKFALTDQVDAKLNAWKGSKADNLRALLGSLEKVLWPEAGWKKVTMADLVLPNKVKIIYMKAIAKVHPDKISQTATTEQRMISAAVFSTLNEAWDAFKKENGL